MTTPSIFVLGADAAMLYQVSVGAARTLLAEARAEAKTMAVFIFAEGWLVASGCGKRVLELFGVACCWWRRRGGVGQSSYTSFMCVRRLCLSYKVAKDNIDVMAPWWRRGRPGAPFARIIPMLGYRRQPLLFTGLKSTAHGMYERYARVPEFMAQSQTRRFRI